MNTLNVYTLFRQIGGMNVLAISGGRFQHLNDSTVELPVSNGYYVEVELAGNDTYTVRQVFKRSGKCYIKSEVTDVYASEIGEVAYQASCY